MQTRDNYSGCLVYWWLVELLYWFKADFLLKLLVTPKSYYIGFKPVFEIKSWGFSASNTQKIILCDMKFNPREVRLSFPMFGSI